MTEEFSRGKPQLKVATMGHAGHGKTTLTAAINHVLSMKGRAKKEGKSFQGTEIHRSEYESDKRVYEHIDAPTDLAPNTISGAAQFDGAILLVSAADGPMQQTKEHIQHAKQSGVPRIVVFLNFCDVVDDKDLLELVELEVRELLSMCEFPGDDVPVITGSALKALGARSIDDPWARKVIDLVASLDRHIPLSETRVPRAPQAAQTPPLVKAPDAARSPGAVPSLTERLRDLFGRKR
ncbi:MAG: GTP-binding protein [Burkholderiales bacterium]